MTSVYGFSQLEVKTNPISILFNTVPLSIEYIITDNIGLEATAGYYFRNDDVFATGTSWSGLKTNLNFKFPFGPDKGGDRFYAFPYLRYVKRTGKYSENGSEYSIEQTVIGGGFGAGYKWVSDMGLLFDFGAGIGKNFSNELVYSDPNYVEAIDLNIININFVARISVGYRFNF